MREEQQQFLARLGRPPARLHAEQAAWALNRMIFPYWSLRDY